MLLVAINGSPRKHGNTATLLQHALGVAELLGAEVKLVHATDALEGQEVPFCRQCSNPCRGKCAAEKPLEETFNLLRSSDALLLGSPVYFGTISAQLKAVWDKSRVLRHEKALLNVVGGAISVGQSRFGGQENALRAMHEIMLVHGMTLVGDGYVADDCGHHGACAQKPASEDQHGLERAAILAKRLVEVAEATRDLRLRK